MFNLCISELSEIIEGSVSLGAMPPLAGLFEPIGQIVVDVREVQSKDVLWTFESPLQHACLHSEEAFARGAMGVVVAGRRIEPWAGKFSVTVADSIAAMHRLMRCLRVDDGDLSAAIFGQDETTREMTRAVWQQDFEAVRSIVASLQHRASSAA